MKSITPQDELLKNISNTALNGEQLDADWLIVEIFETEEYFEALAKYWNELAQKSGATVSMSFEWAWNWWKYFGRNKNRSLFLVTIWKGTQIVGIAPFYKGYSTFGNVKVETRLQLIGSGGSESEQWGYLVDPGENGSLDILVDPSYTELVVNWLIDTLVADYTGADVITFQQVRDDSFVMQDLYPRMREQLPNVKLQYANKTSCINVKQVGSLNGFINAQEVNAQQELLRSYRTRKNCVVEEIIHPEDLEEATDQLIKLHQEQANKVGYASIFFDEQFVQFFKNMVENAFEKGWLWFKKVQIEDGSCAYRMALRYNRCYYDVLSGADGTNTSSADPGDILLLELVQDAISNQLDTVELFGNYAGKNNYATGNTAKKTLRVPLVEPQLSTPFLFYRAGALLYKYTCHEKQLLGKLYQQKGFWGYPVFRWKSLIRKLKTSSLSHYRIE